MIGMIDGRRLKHAWDHDRLGPLLLGESPYDYEPGAGERGFFTRVRQVTDFLRCRTPNERARVLPAMLGALDASELPRARAAAIYVRHALGGGAPNVAPPE